MHLKSIELSGFKSFAKKSSLEFTTPISAIVGPNGSGKSNVAESFRFVLGEQSIKSLRGKRAEDLIFNGGKDSPRANRASVKLVFDNTKRIFNIDFDEVSIERVVNRDSTSEYLINGSIVRLKDIVELLSSAHIGVSGHQIISQGEADRILNANIKERKEMIEDALGLKIFQYKKEESLRKLEKTEENIKQVESLRREIAPHIRFLKKQVEKIEKAEEMKNTLISLYHEYFKKEEEYLSHERTEIDREKKPLLEKSAALERELASAKEVLATSSSKDKKTEEIVKLEGRLKEARISKDALQRNLGRIEGEVSSLLRLIKKQKEEKTSSAEKAVPLREIESIAKEINLEIDMVLERLDFSKIKNTLSSIKAIISNFLAKQHDGGHHPETKGLEEDIRALEAEKAGIESKAKEAEELETKLSEDYEVLKREIEKEKDSNRDAEKAMFRVVAEQNDIRGKIAVLDSRESRLNHDDAEFKRELQEAGMLAGPQALHYKNAPIVFDPHEDRSKQEERRHQIEKIKIRLEDAGVSGEGDVVKEYKETSERDVFLGRELEDLFKSSESLKVLVKELDEKLATEFQTGLLKINDKFKEFFTAMFGGGSASLALIKEKKRRKSDMALPEGESDGEEIEEAEEESEDGLEIEVSLPRKKVKGLMMLSGGERALTSIALLFAISAVNPPPFIILDETDAALDEANSKKYSDMIEDLSKYSQLILITHNRETMSRAGIIYGVTMGADGISRLLSIQFEEAVQVAK
jgi:chromosome segregation protein